ANVITFGAPDGQLDICYKKRILKGLRNPVVFTFDNSLPNPIRLYDEHNTANVEQCFCFVDNFNYCVVWHRYYYYFFLKYYTFGDKHNNCKHFQCVKYIIFYQWINFFVYSSNKFQLNNVPHYTSSYNKYHRSFPNFFPFLHAYLAFINFFNYTYATLIYWYKFSSNIN
uniref:Uncharacterized protein n=1 Tax=Anopheles dirus TaxID=7168 RepID=A0A182NUX6_9DIPT